MTQIKHIKKIIFSFVTIWLLIPATAFAISPFHVYKSESIGKIFRDIAFNPFVWMMMPIILGCMLLPAILLGWLIHRKYIAYSFFLIYPLWFLLSIIVDSKSKLSDILLGQIGIFLAFVLFILMLFFTSTVINNFKKKKLVFSNKDYIPLIIMIVITLILLFLPIRSGHFVCKTPAVKEYFNCNNYLDKSSWFVF